MEVILIEDVDRLGLEGEVVRVADGYARNYLFPRKLAVAATKGALKDLETRRGGIQQREEGRRHAAQALAEKLHDFSLTIRAKTGLEGKLHGSITAADLAAALAEEIDLEVDKSRVELWQPIRQTGDYLVTIRLHRDVTPQLAVSVVSDAPEEAASAEGAIEEASELEVAEESELAEEAAGATQEAELRQEQDASGADERQAEGLGEGEAEQADVADEQQEQ